MALALRSVARATAPHLPSLSATLAPLLAVANAGAFHLRYQNGAVIIEQGSFTGCNLSAIDAAVAAAPAQSDALDAQAWVDTMPLHEKAAWLTVLDGVNAVLAKLSPPLAAITPQAFLDAIKAKAATL